MPFWYFPIPCRVQFRGCGLRPPEMACLLSHPKPPAALVLARGLCPSDQEEPVNALHSWNLSNLPSASG